MRLHRSWLSLDRHDDPPPEPPAPPAAPPAPPAAPPAVPPAPPNDPPRTFDQSQVDRIVQDRLTREREKFAGFDDLKAKAEKFDELEAASQTELEKAVTRAETAETARDQFQVQITDRDRADAIQAVARDAKFIDPAQAYALIDRSKLTFDDSGVPTNAAELVAALAEASPHLVGTPPPPPPGDNDGGPKGDPPTADFSTASQADFAKGLQQHGLRPRS